MEQAGTPSKRGRQQGAEVSPPLNPPTKRSAYRERDEYMSEEDNGSKNGDAYHKDKSGYGIEQAEYEDDYECNSDKESPTVNTAQGQEEGSSIYSGDSSLARWADGEEKKYQMVKEDNQGGEHEQPGEEPIEEDGEEYIDYEEQFTHKDPYEQLETSDEAVYVPVASEKESYGKSRYGVLYEQCGEEGVLEVHTEEEDWETRDTSHSKTPSGVLNVETDDDWENSFSERSRKNTQTHKNTNVIDITEDADVVSKYKPTEKKEEDKLSKEQQHERNKSKQENPTRTTKFDLSKNSTSTYAIPTQEDDNNTINSTETSHHKKTQEEMDEIHHTPSVRYQFSFNLETINLAALRKQFEGQTIPPEEKEPAVRLRGKLKDIYKAVKIYDKDAKIIKWIQKEEDEFLHEEVEKFPKEPIEIEPFFEGFKPNKKAGRVYIRVRIHSPSNQQILCSHMKHWASLNSYLWSECVIQAASSTNIGWIVYSSQYTDVQYMKKFMTVQEPEIEWGFKISAVSNSDAFQDKKKLKKTEWKDRVKALAVHVPTEMAAIAQLAISLAFRPRPYYQPHLQGKYFSERYFFTPQEYLVAEDQIKECNKLVNRQSMHHSRLTAQISTDIIVDPDARIKTKGGFRKTL